MTDRLSEVVVKNQGIVAFLCLEVMAFLIFFMNPISPAIIYATSALFGLYLIYKLPASMVFSKKFCMLLLILIPFLLVPITTANPDYEAVHSYQSLFDTLEQGDNPYVSGTIYHRVDNSVVYGNFNYPPLEIPFYLSTYLVLGAWSVWIMIFTNLLVRLLVCIIFMKSTPRLSQTQRFPFYLFFLLFGSEYPITATFLIVALLTHFMVVKIVRNGKKMSTIGYIPFLFALGLLTKFFVIPILFAFYFYFFKRGERKKTVKHFIVIGVVTVLLLLPFGIMNVLNSTILFNLNLNQRAVYTTFYPNIFSGIFDLAGIRWIYPILAIGGFTSMLYFFDRNLFAKIIYTCMGFMILISTPEPQFLVILLYIIIMSKYIELSKRASPNPSLNSKDQQTLSQQ